jgi:hypothetical protein
MSLKVTLLSIVAFGASVGHAASVHKASYDPKTEIISVDVSYGGGCKEHVFKLQVGACMESYPVQCTVTLIDTTSGDFCEALISKTVTFKAAQYGLTDSYYDNASITIEGSDGSKASFTLKRVGNNSSSEERSYSCPAGEGRFIVFKPEFGEVHFLNADGSEWKQHHDGLNFEELVLESHPAQYKTTISDDEGNKVGSWLYLSTDKSFSAQYRGRTYSGCKAE